MDHDILEFSYHFEFPDQTLQVSCNIDRNSMQAVLDPKINKPGWCRLEVHKCSICPLDKKKHKYCYLALATLDPMTKFQNHTSIERVHVTVTSPERTYYKETDLQKALSSLLGLLMATSGCPFFQKLKPMARFHLPFSTLEDTIYRVISSFLLSEYITHRHKPDMALSGLVEMYDQLQEVNQQFIERLHKAVDKDSGLNAVIILDAFAKMLPLSIETGLDEISYLFKTHTQSGKS